MSRSGGRIILSPGQGLVSVVGVVADNGTTDNTAAFAAAAAQLPAAGGTLLVPAGNIGLNWTVPSKVTLLGMGNKTASSASITHLVGVTSLAGTQVAPLQFNQSVQCEFMEIDGGTGCYYGAYVNTATDCVFIDVTFTGGTYYAYYETGTGRNTLLECGSSAPAINQTIRTTGATIGTTSGSTTITDSANGFVVTAGNNPGDVGRMVSDGSNANIPAGSVITAVASTGSATIDQPAFNTVATNTMTVYGGLGFNFGGADSITTDCRLTQVRFGGGGGLHCDNHITTLNPAGSGGLSNVYMENANHLSNCYIDSCPSGAGAAIVNKNTGNVTTMEGGRAYQNSANHNYLIIDNANTASNGGLVWNHAYVTTVLARSYSAVIYLANGANLNTSIHKMQSTPGAFTLLNGLPTLWGSATQQIGELTLYQQQSNQWMSGAQPSSSQAITLGTAVRNNTGTDALLTVYLVVTAAAAANVTAGVGPSSTPTTQTVVSSFSTTGIVTVALYVPSKNYALINTTATATAAGHWTPAF